MKLTTAYGPSVFLDQAEMATIPVPHQHLPSRRTRKLTIKHTMTSITQGVPDKFLGFHTNATNVLDLATTSESAVNSSLQDHLHWQQLQESTFNPLPPVRADKLKQLLQRHPNSNLVQKVVDGFPFGFSLKSNGPRVNRQPRNLPTAFTHSQTLWHSVVKEVHLGLLLGPFEVQPISAHLFTGQHGREEEFNSHVPYHTFESPSGFLD